MLGVGLAGLAWTVLWRVIGQTLPERLDLIAHIDGGWLKWVSLGMGWTICYFKTDWDSVGEGPLLFSKSRRYRGD